MNGIKRKTLGVLVCMLLLATIPLAAGTTETEKDPELTLDVGRVWLRGLLWRCNRVGDVNHAMALRLHYIEFTPTERTAGMVCDAEPCGIQGFGIPGSYVRSWCRFVHLCAWVL